MKYTVINRHSNPIFDVIAYDGNRNLLKDFELEMVSKIVEELKNELK